MSYYTTGEAAKECGITVRTIQFYDTEGLLSPSSVSENGRRLYSAKDLAKLQLICMLKTLGLSLNAIKKIFQEPNAQNVLLTLLDEQLKSIETENNRLQQQKKAIEAVKENITAFNGITIHSAKDIASIMEGKKNLTKARAVLIIGGILMDCIEVGTAVLWYKTGMWIPFAVGMCAVIVLAAILVHSYYHKTAYICPECHKAFRPAFAEFLWARHTPKTRKLTCTSCHYCGFCVETYAATEPETNKENKEN